MASTAWAWEQNLPPEEKLALLYISNRIGQNPTEDKPLEINHFAYFVGVPAWQVTDLIAALDRRELLIGSLAEPTRVEWTGPR